MGSLVGSCLLLSRRVLPLFSQPLSVDSGTVIAVSVSNQRRGCDFLRNALREQPERTIGIVEQCGWS